jgi:ribosomal protein S17E
MTFFYKSICLILTICALLTPSIYISASILDDLKNGISREKSKVKDKISQIKNEAQSEQNQIDDESKKVCEIQKGYATKHFENRQRERTKEIQEKLIKITKVKTLFETNKQDVNSLNTTVESLTNLLKQKLELLKTRTNNANTIDCRDQQQTSQTRTSLRDVNQKINKLDKEIKAQTREFSGEVQRLIIKLK